MDKKILKAKEEHDKVRPVRKWWSKNGYKVWRVVLFPAWIHYALKEKSNNKLHDELKFSTDMCKTYLDKVMPIMVAHYCEDASCFLISDSDYMGDISFSNFRNRAKVNKKYTRFFLKFSKQVREYILNEYQIDGYEKTSIRKWVS